MSETKAKVKTTYKEVKTVLISQPEPTHSAYFDLAEKYGIQIDFRPFIHVEGVPTKEFRKTRIKPDDFSAIIFTSRNAIDHFFRICEDMRIKMSGDTKYFCNSKATADYLQKFITYRKRKVFVGDRRLHDIEEAFKKYKDQEKFLFPLSNLGSVSNVKFLESIGVEFQEAMMYCTVSSDLSDLKDITYDVLMFFSPLGIKSLYDNFPDFKQNETRLAVYGKLTAKAVKEKNLRIDISAPEPGVPSMKMALENYLRLSNAK